jgi:hypothetical protein
LDVSAYCREIETYLCRKNDGHLIRVVGPSFELVSSWAARGVPLKIAFAGIDRYFERYYRQGPRRRPVKIDFCEADVQAVFDDWRRATGIVAGAGAIRSDHEPDHDGSSSRAVAPPERSPRQRSLPDHLERVLIRLTNVRASGVLDSGFDATIDAVAAELERAKSAATGLRGAPRAALLARLEALDRELIDAARATTDGAVAADLDREAREELAPFRVAMSVEAYERAHAAAVARLLRGRLGLPTIAFL